MRIRRSLKTIVPNSNQQEPSLVKAHAASPLHIFRALLRECTYLPDPNSRKFFHDYVVSRFRAYCPHPYRNSCQRFKQTKTAIQLRPRLLKDAQKGLKSLCRANHGHPQHLSKVLAMTYGRIGPRRHELLRQLKVPHSPVNFEALKDLLRQRSDPANQQVPHPSPQLLALLRSQMNRKETGYMRKLPRQSEPEIPQMNAWGRPTPIKRVRNIKRRWYAKILSRIMPPLPETEWERLRKMALGENYFHQPIARRGSSGERGIGLETYKSKKKYRRPHDLHSRYLRRLWADVFQQCPLMRRDLGRPSGWHIIWPDMKRAAKVGLDPFLFDDSYFDGVDESGKLRASDSFG